MKKVDESGGENKMEKKTQKRLLKRWRGNEKERERIEKVSEEKESIHNYSISDICKMIHYSVNNNFMYMTERLIE